jgi:hypothetical protein
VFKAEIPGQSEIGHENTDDLGVNCRQRRRTACLTLHLLGLFFKAMALIGEIALDLARPGFGETLFSARFSFHLGHFRFPQIWCFTVSGGLGMPISVLSFDQPKIAGLPVFTPQKAQSPRKSPGAAVYSRLSPQWQGRRRNDEKQLISPGLPTAAQSP